MRETAVGFLMLPKPSERAACARRLFATSLAAHGLIVEEWRHAGHQYFDAIISPRGEMTLDTFEQRLLDATREAEERAKAYDLDDFRIVSAEPLERGEITAH